MKAPKRAITSLRVRNFKAVKDTGILKPEGLTVFIGDNGAGKSSVLEALRFLADLSSDTLDKAVLPFRGFEHVRWKGGPDRGKSKKPRLSDLEETNPIQITARGHVGQVGVLATTCISGQNNNTVSFEHEHLKVGNEVTDRDLRLDKRPSHPMKAIRGERDPEAIKNPKGRLRELFNKNKRGDSSDSVHAVKIIRGVTSLSRLECAPSFARFKQKLEAL